MEKITIQDIDFSLNYEGYYWYSNRKKPVLVENEPITADIFTPMPFIVEGNLYCKNTNTSIAIKNIDGEYYIHRVNLSDFSLAQCHKQQYIAHDLPNITHIEMCEYWAESASEPLLAGMTTLVPAWSAFVGFTSSQPSN